MPFLYFDWTYLVFVVPCLIISIICSANVQTTYAKYSQRMNSRGMTGAQAAEYVLRSNGVTGVRIEMVEGKLSDHFDPRTNVIRLSRDVYMNSSIASVGVAAHEAGHAVQHAKGYVPLKLRSAMVPLTSIGSNLAMPIIILGVLFGGTYSNSGYGLIQFGIVLFSLSVVFALITLPVEFNASSRAIQMLGYYGILDSDEIGPVQKVLSAAALTYVAAAASAIASLLRLILIFGRRDD